MFQSVKKRTLLFLSIVVAGLWGILSNYIRTNYSKHDSLLISSAHADVQDYDWTTYQDSGGDGCGGCSSDGDSG
jgi:hypothetical protein